MIYRLLKNNESVCVSLTASFPNTSAVMILVYQSLSIVPIKSIHHCSQCDLSKVILVNNAIMTFNAPMIKCRPSYQTCRKRMMRMINLLIPSAILYLSPIQVTLNKFHVVQWTSYVMSSLCIYQTLFTNQFPSLLFSSKPLLVQSLNVCRSDTPLDGLHNTLYPIEIIYSLICPQDTNKGRFTKKAGFIWNSKRSKNKLFS